MSFMKLVDSLIILSPLSADWGKEREEKEHSYVIDVFIFSRVWGNTEDIDVVVNLSFL